MMHRSTSSKTYSQGDGPEIARALDALAQQERYQALRRMRALKVVAHLLAKKAPSEGSLRIAADRDHSLAINLYQQPANVGAGNQRGRPKAEWIPCRAPGEEGYPCRPLSQIRLAAFRQQSRPWLTGWGPSIISWCDV
ncbi:hypothetical protein DFAR_2540002 [Desulfarculales bacterium]